MTMNVLEKSTLFTTCYFTWHKDFRGEMTFGKYFMENFATFVGTPLDIDIEETVPYVAQQECLQYVLSSKVWEEDGTVYMEFK